MTGLVATAQDDGRAEPRPKLWRVTDRATFAELRRHGQRGRCGPISLTWLPADPAAPPVPPRVAFAVGKAAGGAVGRNRIRRRLRAGLRELQRSGRLPLGTYLVSARPESAQMAWPDLIAAIDGAVRATQGGAG
jgi:ribonuclease P protein component